MMDCIWSEFTINGREDEYTWSKAYFNNTQVVVVKADSNISSHKDLKDKDVEIQEGHSSLNVLEKEKRSLMNSFKSLNKIKEYNTGFMDLESGVCDAIIVDVPLAKYHIKEKGADKFKILDEPIAFEQYGIAFKKGNDDLKNQVQKTLDEMYSDVLINEENNNDYTKIVISKDINIMTPGLNLILGNPYRISIERNVLNGT